MPAHPTSRKLLSSLRFGSLLAYSPNGPGDQEPHRSSKRFCHALKTDGPYRESPAIELAVERLAGGEFADLETFFSPEVVLVPAPSSSPFPKQLKIPVRGGEKDFLWVPRRICQALVSAGKAAAWTPLLQRDESVTRSSRAPARDRPSPLVHFDSISCRRDLIAAKRYVVVDDVVTRGATLLACASRLQEAYPEAEILGFALLRAISNSEEFVSILDPVAGTITLRPQGDTLRRP